MLHILLIILKIVGIIFLIVLGLLLAAVLFVLFVPVRYRLSASYNEKIPKVKVGVSWLLHLVSVRFSYDQELKFSIKIAGMSFYDLSQEDGSDKSQSKSSDKPQSKSSDKLQPPNSDKPEHEITTVAHTTDKSEKTQPPVIEKKAQPDKKPQTAARTESSKNRTEDAGGQRSLVLRIWHKLKQLKDKAAEKLKKIVQKKDRVLAILRAEENQASFAKIKKLAFRLLKHIRPVRFKAKLAFGFEDPALTGQVLGALGVFYAVYANHVTLYPDFEKQRLWGECYASGRIRVSAILRVLISLILDKNIRRIIRSFKMI